MDEEEALARRVLRRRRTARKIERRVRFGRIRVKFCWRSREHPFGRFGGGWQWEVGVQVGGRTVIVNLLVFSLRFDWTGDDESENPREGRDG